MSALQGTLRPPSSRLLLEVYAPRQCRGASRSTTPSRREHLARRRVERDALPLQPVREQRERAGALERLQRRQRKPVPRPPQRLLRRRKTYSIALGKLGRLT